MLLVKVLDPDIEVPGTEFTKQNSWEGVSELTIAGTSESYAAGILSRLAAGPSLTSEGAGFPRQPSC